LGRLGGNHLETTISESIQTSVLGKTGGSFSGVRERCRKRSLKDSLRRPQLIAEEDKKEKKKED